MEADDHHPGRRDDERDLRVGRVHRAGRQERAGRRSGDPGRALVDTAGLPPALAPLRALAPGDSITAVNGVPVHQWGDVLDGIMSGSADSVTIAVAGKPTVVLTVHPDAIEERAQAAQALLSWRPAVVSSLTPGGPADRAGLQPGDTILAVDGTATPQWWDLTAAIEAHPNDTLPLVVARGPKQLLLTVVPGTEVVHGMGGAERTVGRIGVGNSGASDLRAALVHPGDGRGPLRPR